MMHLRDWWLDGLGLLASASLSLAMPLLIQRTRVPPNRDLAREIDELFVAEVKGKTPTRAVHARVRKIYAEYGLPSSEMVGQEAVQEYVVLLSHEPLNFLETLLPQVKRAVNAEKISETSYIYLAAQARQQNIRKKFSGAPENSELKKQIERLFKADQAVRTHSKAWDLKQLAGRDRADGVTAHAIFAKYGLPTFSLVGPQASQEFDDVIQHQPLAFQKAVLPEMEADAKVGQVSPESYAMLLDRIESSSGQSQTYGENFICTTEGNMKPSPIADPKHVDRRRAELGLMPLSLYSEVLGDLYMKNFCKQIALKNRRIPPPESPEPHLELDSVYMRPITSSPPVAPYASIPWSRCATNRERRDKPARWST